MYQKKAIGTHTLMKNYALKYMKDQFWSLITERLYKFLSGRSFRYGNVNCKLANGSVIKRRAVHRVYMYICTTQVYLGTYREREMERERDSFSHGSLVLSSSYSAGKRDERRTSVWRESKESGPLEVVFNLEAVAVLSVRCRVRRNTIR